MYPVLRFNGLEQQLSANDFLTDLRHENGVFKIVIERVAGANSLNQQPRAGIEECGILRFPVAIVMPIGIGQFLAECFCRQGCDIEHVAINGRSWNS
jgi:hypothetical protein